MRCSFHITHLKGYNYHKHFNSIKDHWQKLAFGSPKELCLCMGLQQAESCVRVPSPGEASIRLLGGCIGVLRSTARKDTMEP